MDQLAGSATTEKDKQLIQLDIINAVNEDSKAKVLTDICEPASLSKKGDISETLCGKK